MGVIFNRPESWSAIWRAAINDGRVRVQQVYSFMSDCKLKDLLSECVRDIYEDEWIIKIM